MCEWGHHSHRATKRPWGCGGVPAGRYDTRVLRPPWGCTQPLDPSMPGALSSQDCLVVVPQAFFEDFTRELNVDITRDGWLFPASLYGFGKVPREIIEVPPKSSQPTNLTGRWQGVCTTRLALCSNWIKPPEGGRQLWFYGQEKPHIWKLQCMLKEIIVETRCLKSHLCW